MCLLWAPVSLSAGRNSSCHLKCINIDLVLVVFHCLVKLFHIFFVVTKYALAGTVSKRYIFLKYSYLLLYTSDIKSTYVKRFVMKDVIGSEYIFFHARFSEMFSSIICKQFCQFINFVIFSNCKCNHLYSIPRSVIVFVWEITSIKEHLDVIILFNSEYF